MLQKVSTYITKHALLSIDELHLVALSGGADSVALLRVLQALNYHIEAIHCNFHLRGSESNRDEYFVKSLCEKLNVKLHLIHFDTDEYAKLHQVSIEMAARELRYKYFEQLRQDIGASSVCVAHHQDDSVETLLLNLLRGTGIHGLTGIRPRNGNIIRPLLCVKRKAIENYLDSIGQDYVTDSTNLTTDIVRNRMRLEVLPLLNQINPGAADNICRTAEYIAETERVYTEAVRNDIVRCVKHTEDGGEFVAKSELNNMPSAECFLHEWLNPYGFNRTQIRQLLDCLNNFNSGREFISGTHSLITTQDNLVLETKFEQIKPLIIPEVGRYVYADGHAISIKETDDITISKEPNFATIDASKVKFPLTLRYILEGDRFNPYGMTGTKLLSDYLTDIHLSLHEKRRQLVVADATGQIIWVVNHRINNNYRITSNTSQVLCISIC